MQTHLSYHVNHRVCQQRRHHADHRVCQPRRRQADHRVCQQRRHHAVHRMPAEPSSGRPPQVSSAAVRQTAVCVSRSGRPPQVSSAAVRQTAVCVSSAVIMQSTACQQRLRQADHRESAAPPSCRPPRVSAAPPSCSPPHAGSAAVMQTTACQQRLRSGAAINIASRPLATWQQKHTIITKHITNNLP